MGKELRIIYGEWTKELPELLRDEREVFVVCDSSLRHLGEKITGAGKVTGIFYVQTAESLKTMETVLEICRAMLQTGVSRKAILLAVGGGITTDVAGFAASIYKRGIRYANVPTTLLGMVDAAIGGKTGVNLDGYKNMLGSFRMPEFVLIDTGFTATLGQQDLRAGRAEMFKTFLIADAGAFRALAEGTEPLEKLIEKAVEIKARIVAEDPEEMKGRRILLNLGHSFAHAIESVSGGEICHGDAVSMGLVLAARLADRLAGKGNRMEAVVREALEKNGLPTDCPYPAGELLRAMSKDKKGRDGKVEFVLPERPGKAATRLIPVEEAIDLI